MHIYALKKMGMVTSPCWSLPESSYIHEGLHGSRSARGGSQQKGGPFAKAKIEEAYDGQLVLTSSLSCNKRNQGGINFGV